MARSDPHGLLVWFDAGANVGISRITLDLLEDGEDPIPVDTRDARYVRALAFKPTVEGIFTLQVVATDKNGCTATATSPVKVTVVK